MSELPQGLECFQVYINHEDDKKIALELLRDAVKLMSELMQTNEDTDLDSKLFETNSYIETALNLISQEREQ